MCYSRSSSSFATEMYKGVVRGMVKVKQQGKKKEEKEENFFFNPSFFNFPFHLYCEDLELTSWREGEWQGEQMGTFDVTARQGRFSGGQRRHHSELVQWSAACYTDKYGHWDTCQDKRRIERGRMELCS